LISDADVAQHLTMREAIAAMTAAFEQYGNGAGSIAPRVRAAATHNGATTAIAAMGAALPAGGVVGAKVYSTLTNAEVSGRFNFVIVLFSARTGEPLATIAANEITRFRTAAASAVALRALAPASGPHAPRTLSIFGAGVQARAHAEAFLLTHPFERVLVSARGGPAGGGPAFADWLGTEFGVAAQAVDAATAAAQGEVIVTCTRATEPLFDGATVRPGALVIAVGSSKPQARELDDALLARAERIVVEWLPAAQAEAGEFVRAGAGVIDPARVVELGKLLVGASGWTRRPQDVVVFKSVGVGLEDVALARLVWERVGG
jgi:ornithine cyclodeaminase